MIIQAKHIHLMMSKVVGLWNSPVKPSKIIKTEKATTI